MLMNGGARVNYGNALRGNRRTGQPRPEQEVDVGNVNVDALLGDSEDSHQDRNWTQSLRGLQAQQALNALQKWMLEHDSPNDDRERWRRAYNVMTKLASNCDELPQQLSIDWVGFTENDLKARGAFAVVYKGVDRNRCPVAVKRLHLGESNDRDGADLHRRFKREALVWFQLKHPNILPLQGIFQQNANFTFYPCMISPWVDGGTIFQHIKSDVHNPQQQRVPLLKDVAKGLDYVHERGVSHGDLHDGNILIYQGRAVLTDFGMAVVGDKSNSRIPTTQIPANAIRWLAPELFTEDNYTPRKTSEGDIFAFGRLCLAICTRGVIYPNMPEQTVALHVSMGRMPARPSIQACYGVPISDQLWNLAVACWNLNPSARPSAAQALRYLRT